MTGTGDGTGTGTRATPRLAAWSGRLRCPSCAGALTLTGRTLGCPEGHRVDLSRQGTAHLMSTAAPAADTLAMVDARVRVFEAGVFAPVVAAVADALGGADRVLDVGGGPGGWAAAFAESRPSRTVLVSDVSTPAVRRAARAHPRVAGVVADTWAALPLIDGAATAVTCVFAPRHPSEFARVLAPGGLVVVAHPEPDHLLELRAAGGLLGVEEHKAERLARTMDPLFEAGPVTTVRTRTPVSPALAADLVAMGPNAFHEVTATPEVGAVTIAVRIARFVRR